MKHTTLYLLIATILSFTSCKDKRAFPEVKNLDLFEKTDFLPTLENAITQDKNSIYSPSLLLAWEEAQKIIPPPYQIDTSFHDLVLLNASQSHKKTLDIADYQVESKVEGNKVYLHSFFSRSINYLVPLFVFDRGMFFGDNNVKSFGLTGEDIAMRKSVEILYYENDSNFVIGLKTKEKEEIILSRLENQQGETLAQRLLQLNTYIEQGKIEKELPQNEWKYKIEEGDIVEIPMLKFNIEMEYKTMLKNTLWANGKEYSIEKMAQRTAFLLDEVGAKVESESWLSLGETAPMPPEYEHPKHIIFNHPFLLILKKTEANNPYLVMLVNNSELMEQKK